MDKIDIKSLDFNELEETIKELGLPKFRARQIYDWLHKKLVTSFDEMTNLSGELRKSLDERFYITACEVARMQESKFDGTRKYLFKLSDGNYVESVFMRYHHGNSVCISSQVGCRMGCRFCASTLDGLTRNLQPSEMLDEIYRIQVLTGERVSNVVVMGTGEPMDNYDNILKFIKLLTDENGLNISQRNVTVSTCGIVPNMKLMEACEYYFEKTGRRITFEYALVRDVNDKDEDLKGLSQLAGRVKAHVNLIPVNPIKERDYRETAHGDVVAFKNKLEKSGINVTIRREMGRDIDGACGQLRKKVLSENNEEA